jgi:hypothetical protein
VNFFTLSYILLWILAAFQSLVLVLVLRELGVLYLGRREAFERDGPQVGRPLPMLRAIGSDEATRTLGDLPGNYRALVFGGKNCPLCGPAMEKFGRWSSRVEGLAVVMLAEGPIATNGTAFARDVQPSHVWWLREGEMFKDFGIRATPFAVMVDAEGTVVAKALVNHHGDIKNLIRAAQASRRRRAPTRRPQKELPMTGSAPSWIGPNRTGERS